MGKYLEEFTENCEKKCYNFALLFLHFSFFSKEGEGDVVPFAGFPGLGLLS